MKNAVLSKRLLSAANFVRWGAVFADVGTDHAYLPLFLLEQGKIKHAVCSDVNEGPLETARENAKSRDMYSKIDFILTDGASALEGMGISDFAICGMGGELISDIIDRAPFLKDPKINLILQPMSKQRHLRAYLAASGFSVKSEAYTCEGRHCYLTLLASYTGNIYTLSPLEAELGLPPYDFFDASRRKYTEAKLRSLMRTKEGKERGGENCEEDEALIRLINELLH